MAINLAPKNITEFLTGLPIKWLAQNPVGQANQEVVGYFFDYLNYLNQQAVQLRYPLFTPQDAYGYWSAERKLIKGYNDGYNVSPSLDGYLYPQRLKGAWKQWDFAGSATGLLTQLHYQGLDGYLVQQNGLIHYQDSSLFGPTFFSKGPQYPITITITTGGYLGTMVFQWSYNGNSGSVSSPNYYFSYQIPGTTTVFSFNQANYLQDSFFILNTDGQLLPYHGAITGTATQITGPENALRTIICTVNPNIESAPHTEITIKPNQDGYIGSVSFNISAEGTTTTYQPVDAYSFQVPGTQTWVQFSDGYYAQSSIWTIVADGTITGGIGSTGVITQNSSPWFTIDYDPDLWSKFVIILPDIPDNWTNILSSDPDLGIGPRLGITNNTTSSPSTSDISNLANIINEWKSAIATFDGIFVCTTGYTIGFPSGSIAERNIINGGTIEYQGNASVVVKFDI